MRAAIAAALLACSSPAFACGYCVEDKMASVYDHAVVAKALGQKHQVAFFHVEGSLRAGSATKQSLEKLVESCAAADKGSVRVSVEAASLAVAFDPRRTAIMALQKDIEGKLAGKGLSLMLLQVMDRPADFSPSAMAAMKKEKR